ncbi:hypothetical protein [Saccharothrix longispora]|uniref:hypothetical protein n=1 Tax=Saccharothrix longispora TaxID=33920 RepID=UPI0028FD5682|nr:hypothetical protein [Saccharothrix longispora]MDU0292891.1 hypothetical protein [Saccharothrix longispora]
MSEILIALAALATGVLLGLVVRFPGRRRSPRSSSPAPADVGALLNAVDDLEYGLAAVLNFGPLSASELTGVDLAAKLERLAGDLPKGVFDTLKGLVGKIALHPYPERHDLLGAVREDESAVWLALRDAIGSGAAQHVAATEACRVLEGVREVLRGGAALARRELVGV